MITNRKWCTCLLRITCWLLNKQEDNPQPPTCPNQTLASHLKADCRWLNGNSTNYHFSNLSNDSSVRWLLLGKSRRTCKGERMGNKRTRPQNILVLHDSILSNGSWNICQYFLYAKVMDSKWRKRRFYLGLTPSFTLPWKSGQMMNLDLLILTSNSCLKNQLGIVNALMKMNKLSLDTKVWYPNG